MYSRILQLPQKRHFFLFGARNTGKSTLIKKRFNHHNSRYIDLLDSEEERRYRNNPSQLLQEIRALPRGIKHVIIDEIQKVPQHVSQRWY